MKSRAGRRGIRLPDQLFALLMEHEKAQAKERELAADLWHDPNEAGQVASGHGQSVWRQAPGAAYDGWLSPRGLT